MAHPSRRRTLAGIGAVLLGSSLAGCSDGGNGGQGTTVEMTGDLVYDPDAVTVGVGETVTWTNAGGVDHTVTAYEDELPDGAAFFASGGFGSEQAARDGYPDGAIGADDSFSHTFETAGTYEYFCVPHESQGMTGTVTVEES